MALVEKSEFGKKLRISKIIGLSLITMLFLGIFAEFLMRGQLIKWDDPALTFTNIQNSLILFESGIFAFLVTIVLDVLLSIYLYVLLNSIAKSIGLLMVSFRLIYVAIKGFAIVGLFLARDIYLSANELTTGQSEANVSQAMQFLKMHHYGFAIGLLFFGLHLIFLAILLLKVKAMPKLISWMLFAAGIGYCLNTLTTLFANNLDFLKIIIIVAFIIPMTFSELLFGIWLWIKSKKVIPLLKS